MRGAHGITWGTVWQLLLPRRGRRLRFERLLSGALVVFVVAITWLYTDVRRAATLQPTKPADVIIVLGAGSFAGRPSAVYRARLDHALEVFRRGLAHHIIVTERKPAAQAAHRYLVEQGVPETALALEDQSRTTWENLRNARRIMRGAGWQSAIVVSCPFHLFRALRMCHDLEILAQGASAVASPLEAYASTRVRWSLSECRKYLAYRLFGTG